MNEFRRAGILKTLSVNKQIFQILILTIPVLKP